MNSIRFNFIFDSFVCLSGISDKKCFFPVTVSNENLYTKSEKEQLPIPSSLIKMNDRDKIKLELILLDDALHSAGLNFGFLKKVTCTFIGFYFMSKAICQALSHFCHVGLL